MEQEYLPSTIRDRITDLMKEHHMTQQDLADQVGCTRTTLSRFLSGNTNKLGNEKITRIAEVFGVSADFLLGLTDTPDRKNYEISELGLSIDEARNLYTGKVDTKVASGLLENPDFAETTHRITRYLDDDLAEGFAAQNRLYSFAAKLLQDSKDAANDVKNLGTPIYQADISAIQNSFMKAIKTMKADTGSKLDEAKKKTETAAMSILHNLKKNGDIPLKKITAEQLADAVAQSVEHLPGVDAESVKTMFLSMIGEQHDKRKREDAR